MKRLAVCALFLLAVALSPARAQSTADDQYVIIYSLMQRADSLGNTGEPNRALAEYVKVQGELQRFHKIYPDWNPKIINFRLNYLAEKIAETTARVPATNAPPPAVILSPAKTNAVSPAKVNTELDAFRAQLQSLQADNTTLAAKLKEALQSQPAVIDSRELAKAQEQIRSLMKQNDLLKVGLSQGSRGKDAVLKTNELAQVQAALAGTNQKLAEQMERVSKLTLENRALQARVQSLLASPDAIEALRAENALLKKQLTEVKVSVPTNSLEIATLKSDLTAARGQIVVLKSQVEVGALEKMALEGRIRQLQTAAVKPAPAPAPMPVAVPAPVPVVPSQAANEARIRELTQERDNLLAKLGAANREIYGGKKQGAASQIGALRDEVNTLRARLAVDEAHAVPYTPEELAVFALSAPHLANRNAEKKSIQELPGGSAQLVAEAQHYFATRQFDKAEDDYQKILQHDENNGLVLANLAAIELEQGKLEEAEKHIQAAVAQSPDDAYNLSILGYLKFRQEKYDDALDALSRAAKLDPQNPEIQNYLGVTLGHKGLRSQAETALRKALQLDPNYAAAHNNLAVIYIGQQPPLVQLARWHYQKAIDAGQPHNPDLEKLLSGKETPANPQ